MLYARFKQLRLPAILFFVCPLFSGCGQIGPLFLPTYPPPATVKQIKPGSAPLEVDDYPNSAAAFEANSSIKSPPYQEPSYSLPK